MVDPVPPDGWPLVEAAHDDLEELMTWFADAASVRIWGGLKFRDPFPAETSREDSHWGELPAYRLNTPDGRFAAFGQFYERHERINLARPIVRAALRGLAGC